MNYGFMNYGVFSEPSVNIYECPAKFKIAEKGHISTIADEGLHGMAAAITGEEIDGFLPIRTHYGYEGYVEKHKMMQMELKQLQNWEDSNLMVVSASCGDVLSIPAVQGFCLISLFRGALVNVMEWDWNNSGWSAIKLADGRLGFIRNQFLRKKMFSQAGIWEDRLPQFCIGDEKLFREQLVNSALEYLGVQYRWGGKSTLGLDCSGLTSMVYMLQGILIFRDAKLKDGYPVREIGFENIQKGDLLYFPGHIAMYIGNGYFVHSTGKPGSGGVVVNSLNKWSKEYRKDLVNSLYLAGSIF